MIQCVVCEDWFHGRVRSTGVMPRGKILVQIFYYCCELDILTKGILSESVLGDGPLQVTVYHMTWSPS